IAQASQGVLRLQALTLALSRRERGLSFSNLQKFSNINEYIVFFFRRQKTVCMCGNSRVNQMAAMGASDYLANGNIAIAKMLLTMRAPRI
ncbi:MAG: hypothetical protein JW959_01800, partial [Pirellulales bacterium]|nr:hypothetical protein [Pirellulales bacterium]